jgi:hypothetical protein
LQLVTFGIERCLELIQESGTAEERLLNLRSRVADKPHQRPPKVPFRALRHFQVDLGVRYVNRSPVNPAAGDVATSSSVTRRVAAIERGKIVQSAPVSTRPRK